MLDEMSPSALICAVPASWKRPSACCVAVPAWPTMWLANSPPVCSTPEMTRCSSLEIRSKLLASALRVAASVFISAMLDYFLCALASPCVGKSSGLGDREVCGCGRSPVLALVDKLVMECLFFALFGECDGCCEPGLRPGRGLTALADRAHRGGTSARRRSGAR